MIPTIYILVAITLVIAIVIAFIIYKKLFHGKNFNLFSGEYYSNRNSRVNEFILPGSKSSKSNTFVRRLTTKNVEKKHRIHRRHRQKKQNINKQQGEKLGTPEPQKQKPEEKKKEEKPEIMQFPGEEVQEKIAFQNIKEASSKIDNPGLKDLVSYLQDSNLMKFSEKKIVLGSKKEVEDYIKQEIIDFFKARLDSLKEKASELRKSGKDTKMTEMELILLKSKIRVFSSSFTRRDLDKLENLFKSVEENIEAINQSGRLVS